MQNDKLFFLTVFQPRPQSSNLAQIGNERTKKLLSLLTQFVRISKQKSVVHLACLHVYVNYNI